MSCLAILCLSGLYLEGGVGYIEPTPKPPEYAIRKFGPDAIWRYDANQAANPMGRVAVGHEWQLTKIRWSLELRHESWIGTTADHGQNSVWVSVRYTPWRNK